MVQTAMNKKSFPEFFVFEVYKDMNHKLQIRENMFKLLKLSIVKIDCYGV